jgi:hypothetical protein
VSDALKLGIYVYNQTIYEKVNVEINYSFEKFEACVKIDEDRYYKLEFTGFDYLNLFKEHGIYQLTDTYDVLICDEAHKIITEKLHPLGKRTYRIDYGGVNLGKINVDGRTIFPPVEVTDPFVTAIRDIRFYNFIKNKITKQSIFLTGTPIQKSMEDIVSITKFLNQRDINASNNNKFCTDVLTKAPFVTDGFFNELSSEQKHMCFFKLNQNHKKKIWQKL